MSLLRHALLALTLLTLTGLAATPTAEPTPDSRTSRPVAYVAIGDSITDSGVNAQFGWVTRYGADIERALGIRVTPEIHAKVGATSGEILDMIRHDDGTRTALAGADVVTYQAGINDFLAERGPYIDGTCGGADNQDCFRTMVATFENNWDDLVREVHTLAPQAVFRTMNIYYATAIYDQAKGYFEALRPYLARINARIAANPGARMADVESVYNGPDGSEDPYTKGYLLDDDVHPTTLGHLVIFNKLRALGYDGFSSRSAEAAPSMSPENPARSDGGDHRWLYVVAAAVAFLALVAGTVVVTWPRFRHGRRHRSDEPVDGA